MTAKSNIRLLASIAVGLCLFVALVVFRPNEPSREAAARSAEPDLQNAPAAAVGDLPQPTRESAPMAGRRCSEQAARAGAPDNEDGAEHQSAQPEVGAALPDAYIGALDAGSASNDPRFSMGLAAIKEEYIRSEFGVVLRGRHWIPTIGGGTNMVYIMTGSLPPARVGDPYDVQFEATSGCPPYRWRLAAGEIPPDLRFDADSARLEGIPSASCNAVLFVEVTDSLGARDMAEYFLAVQPEEVLRIETSSLPAAFPGQEYFFQLRAAGGIPPYSWSMQGETARIGAVALDEQTGVLRGQILPFAPASDVPLIVRLNDIQVNVSTELVLRVRSRLSIVDIPEMRAREGDDVAFAFQAAGGLEPYSWRADGALPPGLKLFPDGRCSGKPSKPGRYQINLWVCDSAGQLDSAQLRFDIAAAAPVVTDFEALLSRNSVALRWRMPTGTADGRVRIVRTAGSLAPGPLEGAAVYDGAGTEFLDQDVGPGDYCYAAFIVQGESAVTDAPPPVIRVKLPPDADPFADGVVSAELLNPNAFRAKELPAIVLGSPKGRGLQWGSADVVSLGAATCNDGGASAPYGGAITLEFRDNDVWDGPGADFTVFENVFYICDEQGVPDPQTRFMEPAIVSASQDGVNWRQFKTDFSPRYDPATGALNLRHPYCYNSGFAGVNPVMSNGYSPDPTDPAVSGGDSFDISELGFPWIRYVRIQSTGNRWLLDGDGDLILHNEETGAASRNSEKSGFDLDAVSAIWMRKVQAQ